jgi:predicted GTPase
MNLAIPLSAEDKESARLVPMNEAKAWAQVKVEEGKVQGIKFASSWEEFEEFSDFVIVDNDKEYVWPFIEQNMIVLVAHFQKSIDDIVEAYLFKELNELAY